jgi:hemerythrin-like domain-containing protein
MLTATYTLVALSVEQASVRLGLLSLQQYTQANLRCQNTITLGQLQYACESLDHLYQACHWRKVEIYLIPALRLATQQADQLLDELSRLNNAALDIVKTMQQRTRDMTEQGERHVAQVCAHIESFCAVLLQRLEKEEAELFAIARSAICGDVWFSIANKFLLHDEGVVEARRRKATVIALPRAQEPEHSADTASSALPDRRHWASASRA